MKIKLIVLAVGLLAFLPEARAQCAGHWETGTAGGLSDKAFASVGLPNGDVVVGGIFSSAGGVSVHNIAVYHPTSDTWTDLGGGVAGSGGMGGGVHALLLMPNGDLVVGGQFSQAGSGPVSTTGLARWDGSWHSLGGSTINSAHTVYALSLLQSGAIAVGGDFSFTIGSSQAVNMAVVDPSTSGWTIPTSGTAFDAPVYSLAVMSSGDLIAGGDFFNIDGSTYNHIARYALATSDWHSIDSGVHVGSVAVGVRALSILPSGDVLVGGGFDTVGSGATLANSIATWGPTNGWLAIDSSALGGPAYTTAVFPNGHFAVGGDIATLYGSSANGHDVTIYDGSSFIALGSSVNNIVFTLAVLSNNDLAVAGDFSYTGAVSASRFTAWSTHPLCRVDWNCDGMLGTDDISAYLNDWFAGKPEANFNRDGALNTQDVFDFLTAWFFGC